MSADHRFVVEPPVRMVFAMPVSLTTYMYPSSVAMIASLTSSPVRLPMSRM